MWFYTLAKSFLSESSPGHLWVMFWIVHNCNFHVKAKNEFQFLCQKDSFLKSIVFVAFYMYLCIGQLLVYDNNKVSLICEVVISKEKLDFLHLAWSLDSTYLLTVTTKVREF